MKNDSRSFNDDSLVHLQILIEWLFVQMGLQISPILILTDLKAASCRVIHFLRKIEPVILHQNFSKYFHLFKTLYDYGKFPLLHPIIPPDLYQSYRKQGIGLTLDPNILVSQSGISLQLVHQYAKTIVNYITTDLHPDQQLETTHCFPHYKSYHRHRESSCPNSLHLLQYQRTSQ